MTTLNNPRRIHPIPDTKMRSFPILRMASDHRPVLVGEDLCMQDVIRQGELADVVEQPGGVNQLLVGLVGANLSREFTRQAGDRRGMARRRAIAQRERLDERRKHTELKRSEVDRAGFELVGAILGAQQRDGQILEDQNHQDRAEQDRQAKIV